MVKFSLEALRTSLDMTGADTYNVAGADDAGKRKKTPASANTWKNVTILLTFVCFTLAVALAITIIIIKREYDRLDEKSFPCPLKHGGLLTSGDPDSPGPFHDLTQAEISRLYAFLRSRTDLNLEAPVSADVGTSNIYVADLHLPPKQEVLSFLDNKGPQPPREALVMIFRGDKNPPVVEEYRVGPLNEPRYAELVNSTQRKNPVPFSVRPLGDVEYDAYDEYIIPVVEREVGDILMESYGTKYTDCGDTCLEWNNFPAGTASYGDTNTRRQWVTASYAMEFETLYALDFGVLVNVSGSDPSQWTVGKVWYSGTIYDSLQDLKDRYYNDPNTNKTRVRLNNISRKLKSTQNLRGDPFPRIPRRPPVQVEPDGKRYSIRHRHVSYMKWDFDIRLSSLTGPQIYDVRYHGGRIAYEVGTAEIAVFYSGNSPMQRIVDTVDGGELLGVHSKSLVPGADCPEGATFLTASFLTEASDKPMSHARAMCVFEQNTGFPLRRHLSYSLWKGAYYGGLEESVLIVRTIVVVYNYDYVIDFVFHQNGAMEMRCASTGYILATFYRSQEAPYGFRVDEHISANIHHHMFHFKADLDVAGTSNRYETLDISEEEVPLTQVSPTATYNQIRFDRNMRRTEEEAVYKFNFDTPKYHIVHNKNSTTQYGVPRAYRIHMSGMSKQLLPPNAGNEASISWARQQLAVTVHKDDERFSSSPYSNFDSQDPVTNFSNFISDESIVDKDLVFWITLGVHHIPHSEDIPVVSTVGGHLSFFLLPYNYFPECPSVSSRDQIRVEYVTLEEPAYGLRVERNGNQKNEECSAKTLEQLVRERPGDFVEKKEQVSEA